MRGKAMTLEQIRAALPTHIMLTPRVHRWREGDKAILSSGELIRVCGEDIGQKVDCASVRPIPPHILDNQAFWTWWGQYTGAQQWPINECGGLESFSAHKARGRLYDKWLLEQMEDV